MTSFIPPKTVKHLFKLSLLFLLSGCSTVCFVKPEPGTENIKTIQYHRHYSSFTPKIKGDTANAKDSRESSVKSPPFNHENPFRRPEPIKDICTSNAGYIHCDGGWFSWIQNSIDFFCISCKPKCLVKKAKNDAIRDGANFVVKSHYSHAGETFCVSVTPYHCPTNNIPNGYITLEK